MSEEEINYQNLLVRIVECQQIEDLKILQTLAKSMEIRDYDFNLNLYSGIWLSLKKSWITNDLEMEKIVFEIWNIIQSFPETLIPENLLEITNTLPKDFCKFIFKCFEKTSTTKDVEYLLTWIYIYCPSFRGKIRSMIGHRLMSCVNSPESLRSFDINPLLKLLSKIISGMSIEKNESQPTEFKFGQIQWSLLEDILLPLHSPNLMIEWRDQIPVVQSYHENLVLCLIRLFEWDSKSHLNQHPSPSKQTMVEDTLINLVSKIWPEGFQSNTPKEVLFIHEVEKFIEILTNEEFDRISTPLLKRIVTLLSHENIRPLQRTLQMFRNEKFLNHLIRNSKVSFSLLLPPLYRNGKLFWNQTVNKMTANVLKKLQELDSETFVSACHKLFSNGIQENKFHSNDDSHTLPPRNPPIVRNKRPSPNDPSTSNSKERSMLPPVSKSNQSSSSTSSFTPMTTMPGNTTWRPPPVAAVPSDGSNPPVTITGVAPWAFQSNKTTSQSSQTSSHNRLPIATARPNRPPVSRDQNSESSSNQSTTETMATTTTTEKDLTEALEIMLKYIEECRISGQGGLPDDDGNGTSWAKEQAALKPTLLPELKFHDLVFGQVLGEGSFATVKYCRRIIKGKNTSKSHWPEYAVKILSTEKMINLGRNCLELACREIAALHELSHPGLARLISAFRYRDGNYLVLEYASRGDLHSHILKHGPLDDICTRFVIGEISTALLSIHELGLSFNDLKPENILITELGHIKITDFGATRAVTQEGMELLSRGNDLINNLRDGDWRERATTDVHYYPRQPLDFADEQETSVPPHPKALTEASTSSQPLEAEGTPGYLPPEILNSGISPGWTVDYWSLGCVIYFCLVGRPKYYGTTFQQVLFQMSFDYNELSTSHSQQTSQTLQQQHREVQFEEMETKNEIINPLAQELISNLMKFDPSQRYSLDHVTHHSYITDNDQIDPFTLYSSPAIPLPQTNSGLNSHDNHNEDKEWARRQCSIVWAPMPMSYNFSSHSEEASSEGNQINGRGGSSGVGGRNILKETVIFENYQKPSNILIYKPFPSTYLLIYNLKLNDLLLVLFINFLQFIIPSAALIPLVATLAGTAGTYGNKNGEGTNAKFYYPFRGDISPDGTIFLVADFSNHLLRQIIISTSTVSTLAGQAGVIGITNGAGTNALFYRPTSISYLQDASYALIAEYGNNLIRKIILSTATVTKFAGGGSSGTSSGSTNGEGTNALFYGPEAICISPDGLTAVVAEYNNHMIRKIIITTSVVSTLAGQTTTGNNNGIGTLATFFYPTGVDYFPDGSAILVADYDNYLIRKIIISTAEVATLAGTTTSGSTNGFGTNARFFYPEDIRISPDGSYALVADFHNHLIRLIILSTLFVDTIVGLTGGSTNGVGTNARLYGPQGVAIAPNGEYFLISDGSNNMIRYADILDHPTLMPSLSLAPTRIPTYTPSSSPSISFQPTAVCPPGYIRDIHNEEDPTSCLSCEEGYYSDGGNENSCDACPPLTWNIGRGNTDCEYNTVRNSASDAYPITLCVFYGLLSMVCFGLTLHLGGSWTVFLNILLITTDQITNILYSWYSLFADAGLLYLSFIFCLVNLLFPMMYLLWHLSFNNLLIFRWLRSCSEWYYQYDLTHGNYGENQHPQYAGWIFHSIHGWILEAFFPFSLIYYVIDLIWIIIRILIMILIVIVSIISQLLLIPIGVIFYTSKLMSIPVVEIWFWGQWNPTYLETSPHLIRDDSPVVYNTLILVEICSECFPQFIIQITNSSLMPEGWTPLAILSVIMSGFMIISVFHHFWYKHQKLLHSGDPTYTSFDFSRIPKYDLSENFFTSVTNQRTNYNPTPIPITSIPIVPAPPVLVPAENEVEAVIAVPARAEFVVRVEMAVSNSGL